MKKLLVPMLAISLGGCASLQKDIAKLQQAYQFVTTATVPASKAQIAVSSYEVVEAAATQYFVYCNKSPSDAICASGTVSDPGPLRLAIKYDRQGRAARDQLKAAGKSGALISSTVYNLLVQAVTDLSSTPVTTFGVAK